MNIRAATVRGTRQRVYRPASVSRRPYRARSRAGFRITRLEMAGIAAAMILFGLGMWTSYQVHNMAEEISALNVRRAALQETNRDLKMQQASMLEREHLATIGAKLGLHRPEASQIVTLN